MLMKEQSGTAVGTDSAGDKVEGGMIAAALLGLLRNYTREEMDIGIAVAVAEDRIVAAAVAVVNMAVVNMAAVDRGSVVDKVGAVEWRWLCLLVPRIRWWCLWICCRLGLLRICLGIVWSIHRRGRRCALWKRLEQRNVLWICLLFFVTR